jgi:hypothetical protein
MLLELNSPGLTTGATGELVGHYAQRWMEGGLAAGRATQQAKEAAIQEALRTWYDPNASYAERWQAEQILRAAGVEGLWQGGLPAAEPEQTPKTRGIYRYVHERDANALRQFAADAFEYNELGKNPRGQRMESFGSLWAAWADVADRSEQMVVDFNRNLFVYYSDEGRIVGALHASSTRVIEGAMYLRELESIQPGVGTELLKEGVHESIRRGLEGRIVYDSAPKALRFHRKLAAFTGAVESDGRFNYSPEAARKLLRYPTMMAPIVYPSRYPYQHEE